MKCTFASWLARRAVLATLATALFALTLACVGKPVVRGPDGRPVFRGERLIHSAGSPYFCFDGVTSGGTKVSRCEGSNDGCVEGMRLGEAVGMRVISGCSKTATVYCTESWDTQVLNCAATLDACEVFRALEIKRYTDGKDQGFSSCTPVAESQSFPPS